MSRLFYKEQSRIVDGSPLATVAPTYWAETIGTTPDSLHPQTRGGFHVHAGDNAPSEPLTGDPVQMEALRWRARETVVDPWSLTDATGRLEAELLVTVENIILVL